jgi:hypothetical protein
MQALAPSILAVETQEYERKSFTIVTLRFGLLAIDEGRSRRESAKK